MGVANTKEVCRLSYMSDLRHMYKCIKSITGQKSNSASWTDTWICELKEDTTFLDEVCTHAFMKIGFLNKTVESRGLGYEFQVYLSIISPLLAHGISPNFLRPYCASHQVSYDDLKSALDVGLTSKTRVQRYSNLDRNLQFMHDGRKDRPAIDDDVAMPGRMAQRSHAHDTFLVITTEYTQVTTYREWLSTKYAPAIKLSVLMQILIALHTMQLCQLMHNDLHTRNIFIKELPQPITLVYFIDVGLPISIETKYLVKIYDFDRATCPHQLGDNPFAPTNRFQPKQDLMCLYRNFLASRGIQFEAGVLKVMFDIRVVYPDDFFSSRGSHHWSACNGNDVHTSLLNGIRMLAASMGNHARCPIGDDARIYVAIQSMFSEDSGQLKPLEDQTRACLQILHPLETAKEQYKRKSVV